MAYYPKSQIQTDQYTNGQEKNPYSLTTTGEIYKGYFYKLSNGTMFTGRNPDSINTVQLIVPLSGSNDDYDENQPKNLILSGGNDQNYDFIDLNRIIPPSNLTIPTQPDYKLGEFQRYFTKKNNELKYIEIDKETYTLLKQQTPTIAWDLYTPLTLTWTLTGEQEKVFLVNKKIVALAEKQNKWYGFSQWFKDNFLKYYLAS